MGKIYNFRFERAKIILKQAINNERIIDTEEDEIMLQEQLDILSDYSISFRDMLDSI